MHRSDAKGVWLIGAALACGGSIIIVTAVASAVTHHSAGDFTRDLRTLCEAAGSSLPFYAGAISQLTIMVWASAASLAFLAAYLQPAHGRWFMVLGAFLLLLAADDALTLHEGGPRRAIPEPLFYLLYAAISVLLLIGLLRRRVDDTTIAFVVGGALLAISVIVDLSVDRKYIFEDSLKLLGALAWLVVPLLSLIRLRTGPENGRVLTKPRP